MPWSWSVSYTHLQQLPSTGYKSYTEILDDMKSKITKEYPKVKNLEYNIKNMNTEVAVSYTHLLVKHKWPDEIKAERDRCKKRFAVVAACICCFVAGYFVHTVVGSSSVQNDRCV